MSMGQLLASGAAAVFSPSMFLMVCVAIVLGTVFGALPGVSATMAVALGLTFTQLIGKIVIPQALRSTVLPMTSLAVGTMLTTALGSQVPLRPHQLELTGVVNYINSRAVGGILAFAISAALYVATALVIGWVGGRIDKKVRILR